MKIPESELILNPDGSIYHLNLRPEDLATTIITVGDQDRVEQVSRYFDEIQLKKQHREFKTHTGFYKGKRITVMSTGIGPDNIDIVFNELDALANVDFDSRKIKDKFSVLEIVRVGTSGTMQADIPVDSIIASELGIGFDNLLHFYQVPDQLFDEEFSEAFQKYTGWNVNNSRPYVVSADPELLTKFTSEGIKKGITTTNVGFYGPQGRVLRLPLK
ncbi:MAG: phosphorylase, partial [Flavobacterium sp.]